MTPRAGDGMLHPVPLSALALLVLNDHVLKAHAVAGTAFAVVTGKLSDVAGMVFFPLLLVALCEATLALLHRFHRPSRTALTVAVVAVGVVFALTKTWTPAAELYRIVWGALQWPVFAVVSVTRGEEMPVLHRVRHVMDATDIVALPALVVAYVVGARRCAS